MEPSAPAGQHKLSGRPVNRPTTRPSCVTRRKPSKSPRGLEFGRQSGSSKSFVRRRMSLADVSRADFEVANKLVTGIQDRGMTGSGFLAIWSDLPPEDETDWIHWMTREHSIERVRIEGFLSCRIFRALDTTLNRYL